MKIELIHLKGFKSIADSRIENASAFSVFAGANGAGKSNLADGLAFFGAVIKRGAEQAIREFGGYVQLHCFKHEQAQARTASLELKINLKGKPSHYIIHIHNMDTQPVLEEEIWVNNELTVQRKRQERALFFDPAKNERQELTDFSAEMSVLMLFSSTLLYQFLTNIKVFRFDPLAAKEPDSSASDSSMLDIHGCNIATMLAVLERNPDFREQVLEWVELLVPGMEKVFTQKQALDGATVITFKEEGTENHFPARLISDGTIYALCIITAILSRSDSLGFTFIEEPERGIHPKAISELVSLMRDYASTEHPVFVTTHSESVVRSSAAEELWLMNKIEGKTQLQNAQASGADLEGINLDKAWLMNFFNGGLPW